MLRSLATAVLIALAAPSGAVDLRLFTVGSGEVAGSYFAAAQAICDSVNRVRRGILRCSPEATPGSLYNLAALRDHQLDFALVQSDWQRSAYQGADAFASAGPMENLRSVMSLYPEAVTVLAGSDSGIATMADLPGKRIDVGPPASGRRGTVMRIIDTLGVDVRDFSEASELPTDAAIYELCAGNIDATILVVGHPNGAVARALRQCHAILVPMTGPDIDAMFGESTDYAPVSIPRTAYLELTADMPSYAVIATVITRTDIAADLVEALVAETLADLPQLAQSAPVLAGLDLAEMRSRGLTAPLHPGAQAAFNSSQP